MNLELRVVDRGERAAGYLSLRDVYLRDGGETLLYRCRVTVAYVDRITALFPGVTVRQEAFTGAPDGTRPAVAGPDGDGDGDDTDLYEPDAGEPVG